MTGGALGAFLVGVGLVLCGGLGLFAVACRLSAAEPRGCRDARRIAAWQRVGPGVLVVCSLLVAVGAVLLVAWPG